MDYWIQILSLQNKDVQKKGEGWLYMYLVHFNVSKTLWNET